MPLTPDQQAAADALTAAFGKFMTSLGSAPAVPPGTPPAESYWWDPSPADHVAFAAEHNVSVESISPIVDAPAGGLGTAFPKLPAVSSKADVLKYAGFGFGPDGTQRLYYTTVFAAARSLCRQMLGATTVPQMEALVVRGSTTETDAIRLALMTRLITPGVLIQTVYPLGPTVDSVIAVLTYVAPGGTQPGPGGPR